MSFNIVCRCALVLLAANLLAPSRALADAPPSGPGDVCAAHASASAEAITRGRFVAAGKHFSPTIANKAPPARLKAAWQAVQQAAGVYRSLGTSVQRKLGGHAVQVIPVAFAHANWDFLYTCDERGLITTARLMPAAKLDAAVAATARAARGAAPIKPRVLADGVRMEPLAVPSPYGPLRGALTLPAGTGPFPAVVLVGGSGPGNLDEAVGGSRPFRDIADGLAAAGIASLRYDKRQADYPFKMAADAHLTVDQEETDDALSAARLLARQAHVDPRRVFVAGHSEGGMLAPRIGQKDTRLAGIIMLAAPARPLLAVLREQTREQGRRQGLPRSRIDASEKALAAEQSLLDKAKPGHSPPGSFGGAPQSWWMSLHEYNQVAVARTLSMPMLILQGGRDFQVSPTRDFDAWKAALKGRHDVTFHLYPRLSHLFTPAGETLTPADYRKPARVDPQVIRDMATWMKAQAPATGRGGR